MKKKILLLSMLLVMSALSYSATKPSLEASLNSIENKFDDLLEKEKVFEKLKKDSEVRWHRDKYKQVLNNYDVYYKNIAKLIREKEQKIAELEQILAIMGN